MKKTILSALIAATALVPVMASAQEWQGRRGAEGRAQREARPDRPQQQPNADREAFRAQRQAQRQEQRAAQPQDRPAFDRADRESFRAQRQGDGSAQLRAQRDTTVDAQRDQPPAGWYGNTPAVRPDRRAVTQDFRRERRDDRSDFRQERRDDRRDLNRGVVTPQQYRADRRDDRQDYRRDRRDDNRDFRRDQNRGNWNGNSGWNNNPGWNNNSGWNRGNDNRWNRQWRNDNRYNWQSWRGQNRNAYRLPRYYAPRGYNYGYQRFGIGVTLGSILFSQNYWINDPYAYRLPPAYGPYRWVRYYNDALLVDIDTGEVVDVINDIFW